MRYIFYRAAGYPGQFYHSVGTAKRALQKKADRENTPFDLEKWKVNKRTAGYERVGVIATLSPKKTSNPSSLIKKLKKGIKGRISIIGNGRNRRLLINTGTGGGPGGGDAVGAGAGGAGGGAGAGSQGGHSSTEVRSPTSTSTSTEAETYGNVTVTGGAGAGANTDVRIENPSRLLKKLKKGIRGRVKIVGQGKNRRLEIRT